MKDSHYGIEQLTAHILVVVQVVLKGKRGPPFKHLSDELINGLLLINFVFLNILAQLLVGLILDSWRCHVSFKLEIGGEGEVFLLRFLTGVNYFVFLDLLNWGSVCVEHLFQRNV